MVILGSVVLLRRMLLFVRMLFHCRMLVTVVAILLYGNVPTIPPPRRGYALILWEPDPCSIVSDSGVVVACSCVSRHVSNTMLHVWVRPTTISILWWDAHTRAISHWIHGVDTRMLGMCFVAALLLQSDAIDAITLEPDPRRVVSTYGVEGGGRGGGGGGGTVGVAMKLKKPHSTKPLAMFKQTWFFF